MSPGLLGATELTRISDAFAPANGTSPPPSPPPHFPPDVPGLPVDTTTLMDVFTVLCAAVGILFCAAGQRVWKHVVALMGLITAGGASGYVLIHFVCSVGGFPTWAAALIALGIGGLAAYAAKRAAVLGLIAFAGWAGLVVSALTIRAAAPVSIAPTPRVVIITGSSIVSALLATLTVYKCGDGPTAGQIATGSVQIGATPPSLSAASGRKIVESLVTSIVGAYGVIFSINYFWRDESVVRPRTDSARLCFRPVQMSPQHPRVPHPTPPLRAGARGTARPERRASGVLDGVRRARGRLRRARARGFPRAEPWRLQAARSEARRGRRDAALAARAAQRRGAAARHRGSEGTAEVWPRPRRTADGRGRAGSTDARAGAGSRLDVGRRKQRRRPRSPPRRRRRLCPIGLDPAGGGGSGCDALFCTARRASGPVVGARRCQRKPGGAYSGDRGSAREEALVGARPSDVTADRSPVFTRGPKTGFPGWGTVQLVRWGGCRGRE